MLKRLMNIRSHRSFIPNDLTIPELRYMIMGARVGASARNDQKIRFALITEKGLCKEMFKNIRWAGAIPWNPSEAEAPNGYIVLLGDEKLASDTNFYFDMGVASQNIMLMADTLGLGGCIIRAFNQKNVGEILNLNLTPYIVLALGKPSDVCHIVPSVNNNTTYARVGNNQFVPKLPLDELIILEK